MPRRERIFVVLAALVLATFVASLHDSGPKLAPRGPRAPPVPASITERPASVRVWVDGEDGARLAGASVRVLSLQDDRAYLAGAARTEDDGGAILAALPLGETWILAEGEGFSRASTRLALEAGPREVKLRLRGAHALRVAAVDDGGAPVPGVEVEVRTGDPLPFTGRANTAGQALIGRLGPPPWSVRVGAPGFEPITQSVTKASDEPLQVTLRRLGWIDVMTVDADGRAIGGATVAVVGSGLWPARKTRADHEGRAKIPDLPRGVYDLRATQGDLASRAEIGVALGRGESKSVTLVLAPGRRVAVRVTDGEDEGAAPVPGANVVLAEGGLSSFPLEAATDPRGTASLGPIAAGEAYLSVRAEGFVARTGVAVPAGGAPSVRVALARGGALRGDVVDARGFAVGGASVEVVGTSSSGEPIDESPARMAFQAAHFSWALAGPQALVRSGELGVMPGPLPGVPHGPSLSPSLLRANGRSPPPEPWVTHADGTFRAFPIPPGRVRAIVRHPAYVEAVSDVVTIPSAGEARVRVVLRGGASLEGRVLDERRIPLAGARVDLAAARGSFERTTSTADDGTFAFAGVPDDIVVSVSRPDAADDVALRANVTVPEGGRKEMELVLPALRDATRVEVADDRGAPLDGARVLLLSLAPDAPLRRTLFTDRAGRATFKDAVGLPVRLTVSHRGRASEVREIAAAPAELRVELAGGASVTGAVTTRRGRDPLDGADVTLHTAAGALHARTGRDGAFQLDDVPPGAARLAVSRAGYAKGERAVQIERPPRERSVALDPIDLSEGGSVEGEVVDARGDPVAGARVAAGSVPVYLPAGRGAGVVLTNQRGEFKLEDLAEGALRLEAYAPGIGRGRVSGVSVASGRATRDVRIALTDAAAEADPSASGGVAVTLEDRGLAEGIVVGAVAGGSEAERGGIERGDRVVAIDGRAVSSIKDAERRLFGPAGDDVVLEVLRGGEKHRLRVAREKVRR